MNFSRPSGDLSLTHEQRIARDTEWLRWKMEKAVQRREASQDGFHDEETVLIQRPTVCTDKGCDRETRVKGLCERDCKRRRRARGKTN